MYKTILLFFWFTLLSCSNERKDITRLEAIKYPNQDAPLDLLMREMFEDMEMIKISVEKGKSIKSYIERHKALLIAKPTDMGIKTESFQSMGIVYLASLRQLELSQENGLLGNYKSLVSSCLACHNDFCPGPIKRINLLKLD